MRSKYLLHIFPLIVFILAGKGSYAQNDFHFSHYMYNFHTYNPANAGSSSNIIANLVARKQWVGMDGSPLTTFVNAHAYVPSIHGGAGLTIYNDRLGFENHFNARLSYAYHLRLSEKATLAMGTGVGVVLKSLQGARLIYEESGDQNAITGTESQVKPDVSFGLELNTRQYTVGFSTTHTDQNIRNSTIYKVPRHYYLYGKYNIKLNEEMTLTPSFLVKSTYYITQPELSATASYKNKMWGGLTFRYNEALAALVGFNIDKNWKVGYSYDFNVGKVMRHSNGSHEIMISSILGSFNKKKHNYKTPRFFN